MGIIYFLFDPRETEPKLRYRYVGKTCKSIKVRLNCHLADARSGRKGHKNNWIRSLLSQNIQPSLQIIEIQDDNQVLLEREVWWIAHLREQGYNLVNDTDGGEGITGWSHSETTKQKIREKAIGRPVTQEAKEKRSKSMSCVKWSNETNQKRSKSLSGEGNPMYGKTGSLNPMFAHRHTEESKKKMIAAKSKVTDEQLQEQFDLGISASQIAHNFNMTEQRVRLRCNQLGLKFPKKDTSGPNAPMYGRHEPKSPETRQKIREAQLRYHAKKRLDKSQ